MNRVNLVTLSQHESVLRQQAQLAIVQSQQTTDRMMQLTAMLYQSLAIVSVLSVFNFKSQVLNNQLRLLLPFHLRSIHLSIWQFKMQSMGSRSFLNPSKL